MILDDKMAIINTIELLLGVDHGKLASLAKSNKKDLQILQDAIVRCAHYKDIKK